MEKKQEMKYESTKFVTIFSNGDKLEYGKISTHFGLWEDKRFDFMYAMHESFWHFKAMVDNAIFTMNETGTIDDEQLIITSISYADAVDKISNFLNLLNLGQIEADFKRVVKENIVVQELYGQKMDYDWDNENHLKILKDLGMYDAKKEQKMPSNISIWRLILKNVRNKLVHPNSEQYDTIHILGNSSSHFFPTDISNKKYFKFKSSFSDDVQFAVDKNIFIHAIKELEKWCEMSVETWNKKILKKIVKESKVVVPSDAELKEALESHIRQSSEETPLLRGRYDLYKLYRAGKLLDNNQIVEYVFYVLKLESIFASIYNDNFWKSKFGKSIYGDLKWKFIEEFNGQVSTGYASEKIGYWKDEQVEKWFPTICEKINFEIAGRYEYDYEERMIAICIKNLEWEKILKDAKHLFDSVRYVKKEKLSTLDF